MLLSKVEKEENKGGDIIKKIQKVAEVAFFKMNLNNRRIDLSEEASIILGFPASTDVLTRERFLSFIHLDDRGAAENALNEAIETGQKFQIEYRVQLPNGDIRYIQEKGVVEEAQNGNPNELFCTIKDISQEIAERNELVESKNLLQSVLNTIPSRVFWRDRQGRYLGCNALLAKDAGLIPDQIIGKSDHDLIWGDRAELHLADDADVIKHRTPKLRYEEQDVAADGTDRWLELSKIPLMDSNDHIIGVLGIYHDITKRKKAEIALQDLNEQLETKIEERITEISKLSQAIEQSPNSVVITNVETEIEYVNERFSEVYGYEPEEVIGKNISILGMDGPNDTNCSNLLNATIQRQKWSGELQLPKKDGLLTWQLISVSPLANSQNEITHLIITQEDVSRLKETESKLKQALEEAEQASKSKSVFLSSMSHELRTPLTLILGYSQILKSAPSTIPYRNCDEYITKIIESSNLLLRTVDSILELSELDALGIEAVIESICLNDLFETVIEQSFAEAQKQHVVLHYERNRENLSAMADERMLQQVLLSIISNAIKYNKKNGRVYLDCQSTDKGFVKISVSDTGLGIPDSLIDRIYEPFDRVGAENASIEGIGIGLTIAKKQVEKMNGSISVNSEQGKGTVFTIILPLSDLQQEWMPRNTATEQKLIRKNESKKTLLYFEDNDTDFLLMKTVTNQYPDICLKRATSTEFGGKITDTLSLKMVFIKISPSEIDSIDLRQALKNGFADCDVPIVAILEQSEILDEKQLIDFGFAGYLSKPLKIGMLRSYLEDI